ncbi:hypothetical protein [Caudoviricetes sp.]|nr:hypothetical protein [Caudoviricetes sp.]
MAVSSYIRNKAGKHCYAGIHNLLRMSEGN